MNESLVNVSLIVDHKSADLTAAYMANRPLAMCNQLTGCGKPERRAMK